VAGFWEYYGIARSLIQFSGIFQARRMARCYREFIQPGDLCFDIGAHLGSRIRAWSHIGARIVAVEPQPHLMRLLRRWFRDDPNITLIEQALGATPGRQTLHVSRRTPTVTTLSPTWIATVQQAPGWLGTQWETSISVPVTTLDTLIARYGEPAFCKIDVEGYELEVLRGLSRPLRCLSFEYIPAARDFALACVDRLNDLGAYEFNSSPGDNLRLRSPNWLDGTTLTAWLKGLPAEASPGDVYARLKRPGASTQP
jgi:FkbM family methyltransferase